MCLGHRVEPDIALEDGDVVAMLQVLIQLVVAQLLHEQHVRIALKDLR